MDKRLPDELLGHIAHFLSNKDRFAYAATSRATRRALAYTPVDFAAIRTRECLYVAGDNGKGVCRFKLFCVVGAHTHGVVEGVIGHVCAPLAVLRYSIAHGDTHSCVKLASTDHGTLTCHMPVWMNNLACNRFALGTQATPCDCAKHCLGVFYVSDSAEPQRMLRRPRRVPGAWT